MALITYHLRESGEWKDKLKTGTDEACNFWNFFCVPDTPVVLRVGVFTEDSTTIARAYQPRLYRDVMFGDIEFNTKFLATMEADRISSTLAHEIGHTLGFGFGRWFELFSRTTCRLKETADIGMLLPPWQETLRSMMIEGPGHGPGTSFVHWDEDKYGKELMTGFKNDGSEHVFDVTIAVLLALGHALTDIGSTVLVDATIFRVQGETRSAAYSELVKLASVEFHRQDEARRLTALVLNAERSAVFEVEMDSEQTWRSMEAADEGAASTM